MTEAFILGGVRTPFARYGKTLSHIRTDDLLGMAMAGACDRVGVDPPAVEDVMAGCVNPAHEGLGDVARWAALAAGFPDSVAAATVNGFCGSSLSATIAVAHAIKAGDLGVGIACGVESMSRSGWALMNGDAALSPRGPVFMLDTMWAGAGGPPHPALLARNAYISMIETAALRARRIHPRRHHRRKLGRPVRAAGHHPDDCRQLHAPDRRGPNGGAVAIGHPFGATGTRYVLTLATELRERHARYGVIGVCVGSGQGVALVLENPDAR